MNVLNFYSNIVPAFLDLGLTSGIYLGKLAFVFNSTASKYASPIN